MSYYKPDVYYQPEHFNLTRIGMISDPEADYSFDDFCVWEHEDGRLFYASDSGCSCPSPFEDYTRIEDLIPITKDTYDQFYKELMDHSNHLWYGEEKSKNEKYSGFKADKVELAAKVFQKLNK